MLLSEKETKEYIRWIWGSCPKCGSDNISGGMLDTGSCRATQPIWCLNCEFEWTDIYKLIGIEY